MIKLLVLFFISCLSMDRDWILFTYFLAFVAGCCFATVTEESVTAANINDPFILEGE